MNKNEKLITKFKINNLTKVQYETALIDGTISADELYCVSESTDLELNEKVDNLDKQVTVIEAVATSAIGSNYLDNSNFLNPVNQRGVTGKITTAGYFLDRWRLVSGTVTISANGIVLSGTISQILPLAVGTDVTASTSAGTCSYNDTTKTLIITATGQTITWAKLENGKSATKYIAKGFSAEITECSKYFMSANQYGTMLGVWSSSVWVESSIGSAMHWNAIFKAPIPMRIPPSIVGTCSYIIPGLSNNILPQYNVSISSRSYIELGFTTAGTTSGTYQSYLKDWTLSADL